MTICIKKALLSVIGAAICGGAAGAQDRNLALISGHTLKDARGGITVNLASGNANQQLNGAAFADGGSAFVVAQQHGEINSGALTIDVAAVMVLGDAFAGAQGLSLVNLASGDGNLQANAVAIAIGVEGLAIADVALSQTRSGPEPTPPPPGDRPNRTAVIGDLAFRDAAGILQVNAVAGSRNSLANTFALTTPFGAIQ